MDPFQLELIRIISAAPGGVTRADLLLALKKLNPSLTEKRLENQIHEVKEHLTDINGRLVVRRSVQHLDELEVEKQTLDVVAGDRMLRIIAIDIEARVRPIEREPYSEHHMYQVGAVRFGRDQDWVIKQPTFNAYLELPMGLENTIGNEANRNQYKIHYESLFNGLKRFSEFAVDADLLVAHNGCVHDFPVLNQALKRVQLPPIDSSKQVDSYYLALTLWPTPPREHRLVDLIKRFQIDVGNWALHEALGDANALRLLVEHGARWFGEQDELLQSLIASATRGSNAWQMLFDLLPQKPSTPQFFVPDITELVANQLDQIRVQDRASVILGAIDVSASWSVPEQIKDSSDPARIDVYALANAAKAGAAVGGTKVERRESQQRMVEVMRRWRDAGDDGLVEAPTGTGKSYALLALALEWIGANSNNRAVISTYTKQLQSQFANDIDALAVSAIPGIGQFTGLVKGARNRLSLRALITTLAALSNPVKSTGNWNRFRFANDPRFRELVVFLILRLFAGGKQSEIWESQSVDPEDVPPFFLDYCPRVLNLYLESLSQARNGEIETRDLRLARFTMTVEQALKQNRLVIANHALLLAHLDGFDELGASTLLLVDEAHSLENAATSALSPAIDSPSIEAIAAEVQNWLFERPSTNRPTNIVEALFNLERFLESERWPAAAENILSTHQSSAFSSAYLPKATVASPVSNDAFIQHVRGLRSCLVDLAKYLSDLADSYWTYLATMDVADEQRESAFGLAYRLRDHIRDLRSILAQFDALLGPLTVRRVENREVVNYGVAIDQATIEANPNHVIWMEQLDHWETSRGVRALRTRVTTSPVELGREPEYQRFLCAFGPTFFISATLKVAGRWDFIRERLALLESTVHAIDLPSPFDLSTQALLVCFDDFPSWSEQNEAAVRTVAHQVAGFARELASGPRNGAMVLTTSKSAACGIAAELAKLCAVDEGTYRITSTQILGNRRAVEVFRNMGGVLVGTKGLWQGVDIPEPDRLRMVWINKLPFAAFNDPVVVARRTTIRIRAEASLHDAQLAEEKADETYYLPLAAMELRQAIGRLIRSRNHRGVVIISDRKLSGMTRQRKRYREFFLGSLETSLTGTEAGVNTVTTMAKGWARIWSFFTKNGVLDRSRIDDLTSTEALNRFTQLPQLRAIREAAMTDADIAMLQTQGGDALATEFRARAAKVGGLLTLRDQPVTLKDQQLAALDAIVAGKDLLAILPTGYGKSFVFQLPALLFPGVTIVVSPLVSLMTDQALALNRTVAGAVRALVAPMRESNSRLGKSEIFEQLTDRNCRHGIKIVYLSPERLSQRQFQDWIRTGIDRGIVRRIAIDEAHTFIQWGDDFRPSFHRAERFIRDLKTRYPTLQLIAVTATATRSIRNGLRRAIFGIGEAAPDPSSFALVSANPIRPELALYRRTLGQGDGSPEAVAAIVEQVAEQTTGHAIFYCLTVREVEALTNYLREQFADRRILKFHGRLSEVEKTSVLNEFKGAPKAEDEDFYPLIVVATSAFGLGIDRPDIRTVFVISPPADLAALYQQLGRAGRDLASGADPVERQTSGLVLATNKSFRTLKFMTEGRAVDWRLLAQISDEILKLPSPLDVQELAWKLCDEHCRLKHGESDESEVLSEVAAYRSAIMRVYADLVNSGCLDDLGDYPRRVAIRTGEVRPASGSQEAERVSAIFAAFESEAKTVDLSQLYEGIDARFQREFSEIGSFWIELLRLHALGALDVSQQPNMGLGYLTGFRKQANVVPRQLIETYRYGQSAAKAELDLLHQWFQEDRCLNDGLREYFDERSLPAGTCETDDNRCSNCRRSASGVNSFPLLEAFTAQQRTRTPRERGQQTRVAQAALDRYVEQLLWQQRSEELTRNIILKVLKGDETYFSTKNQRVEPLWPPLLGSNVRGVRPFLKKEELDASLDRLAKACTITLTGNLWSLINRSGSLQLSDGS